MGTPPASDGPTLPSIVDPRALTMVLPLGDLHRTRIIPWVTYALIAANVVMFLVQSQRGDQFTMALACTPWEVTHATDLEEPILRPGLGADAIRQAPDGRMVVDPDAILPHAPSPIPVWMTLLTCMFLHGGLAHLLGNMLYLWIVGDNVEEVLGGVRYLLVYLACGLMGSLAQIAAAPNSTIPTLGASGAIAGIMGAYVVWFPHNQIRVLVFRFITLLPAVIVIGGWIVFQIFLGVQGFGKMGETGGVAYLAHVGGALTGIGVAFLFYDRAQQVKAMDAYHSGWTTERPYGY